MITGALISLLAWVITGAAFLLPSGTFLPVNFADLLSDVIEYAYGWDWILPMGTVFSIFGVIIIFMVAEFAWKGAKYMVALFRGN